jgi:hypothetical protein
MAFRPVPEPASSTGRCRENMCANRSSKRDGDADTVAGLRLTGEWRDIVSSRSEVPHCKASASRRAVCGASLAYRVSHALRREAGLGSARELLLSCLAVAGGLRVSFAFRHEAGERRAMELLGVRGRLAGIGKRRSGRKQDCNTEKEQLHDGLQFRRPAETAREGSMTEFERKRDQMIEHLEQSLALADELHDSLTGYLIERALDEARAGNFRSGSRSTEPQ